MTQIKISVTMPIPGTLRVAHAEATIDPNEFHRDPTIAQRMVARLQERAFSEVEAETPEHARPFHPEPSDD